MALSSMRYRAVVVGTLILTMMAGCIRAPGGVHYLGDADLETYRRNATQIAFPDVRTMPDERATGSLPPRQISDLSRYEIRDLTLQEAVHLALENSAIIRTRGQFFRPAGSLLQDSSTVFDPAIQESETTFGRMGVEAALSEFDAQYSLSMLWGRDERIQNNPFGGSGVPAGQVLSEDTAAFRSQLAKQLANGGRVSISNVWNYEWNNSPARLFPSVYVGQLEAEYRQPLLAGAGTDFTRTAGSVFRRDPYRDTSGLDQGVLIARIRTDQILADFQSQVTNLVKDVEDLYWELVLAYHVFDTETVARNGALRTWREAKVKLDEGLPGGTAADEAQAADAYFDARSRSESALAELFNTENQLRRLLGLPVNDGFILRPCDDPMTAEFVADWHMSIQEAMAFRPELRRQKWELTSLSYQLNAAKSLVRPRLDFVSRYRVNGFGDNLGGQSDDDGVTEQGLNSALETITQGDQTGWNLGFEFSAPIGFRNARSQVRNIELKLARARRLLSEQEVEISHELAQTFTDMDRWHRVTRTNLSRRTAAARRVEAFQSDYDAGRLTAVDALLRAQISLAQAENAYFRSLVEYNRAVAAVYYRKGTLLERNNIRLAEDRWCRDAYDDALRRAWARTAALPADWILESHPAEFERRAPPAPASEWQSPADHNRSDSIHGAGASTRELAPFPAPVESP